VLLSASSNFRLIPGILLILPVHLSTFNLTYGSTASCDLDLIIYIESGTYPRPVLLYAFAFATNKLKFIVHDHGWQEQAEYADLRRTPTPDCPCRICHLGPRLLASHPRLISTGHLFVVHARLSDSRSNGHQTPREPSPNDGAIPAEPRGTVVNSDRPHQHVRQNDHVQTYKWILIHEASGKATAPSQTGK